MIVFLSYAPFELRSAPASVNPDDHWTEPGVGSVGGMNEYTEGHTEGRGCRVALRVHHIQVIDCARGEGILIRHARVMLMIIGGSRKQLETHALLQARMAPYLRRKQSMHKQPLCPLNEDKQ